MSKLSSDLLISWQILTPDILFLRCRFNKCRDDRFPYTLKTVYCILFALLWFTPFHLKFPWLFKYLFLFSLTLWDSWVHGKGTALFVEILYKMFQNGFKFLACNCSWWRMHQCIGCSETPWLDGTVPCPDAMFRAIISRAQSRWREQWLPLM